MKSMTCPSCGRAMELGHLQCRDGVTWTPKKQLVAALSAFGTGAISLENGASHNSNAVYAFHCSTCKKVIIDYSDAFRES